MNNKLETTRRALLDNSKENLVDLVLSYLFPGSKECKPNIWKDSIILTGLHTHQEALDKCPDGYRLPTKDEFVELKRDTKYSFEDGFGIFEFEDGFELRLPASGSRSSGSGELYYQGSNGAYWSTTINGSNAFNLNFNSGTIIPANSNNRANGFALRCVKNLRGRMLLSQTIFFLCE